MTSTCSGCFPVYQYNQLAHCDEGGCLYCPFVDNENNDFDDIVVDLKKLFDEVSSDNTSLNLEFPSNMFDVENLECCICFENIDQTKNNCTTDCGHSFCFSCIATSIAHNNHTCPYCRSVLINTPKKTEVDDVDDEDDDDDDNDDDVETDHEYEDEDYFPELGTCPVDEIISRLEKSDFSMKDIVCLLLERYDSNDVKYTVSYVSELYDRFNKIVDDADKESYEQELFAAEDTLH